MSPDIEMRPPDDSWVVAVHSSKYDVHPSGSGLVIDRRRILTCAHVARRIQDSGAEIWVAFPKSKKGPVPWSRVAREHVTFADSGAEVQDLAILHLSQPVPPGVDPVPLRDPASASLLSRRWWAFGFPQGHPAGNSARGTVGEVLASGLLRIDRKSRYGVEAGFSGAGVWSPEYRAVVAVITDAESRRGDGQAIPLHHLEACFPGRQIADLIGRWSAVEAGDVALSAWGWSLTGDPEAGRHWSPRARGVTSNDERGYRFRGRTAALQVIKDWLDHDRDRDHRRMLVVTGAPGAGKSAVLGRIVTTADADAVRELPSSDAAVRAAVGSVACAVHAKGKTALEVATEIARAASAELPDGLEDFPRVLHAALIRQDRRFSVIIDALDEAVSLSEARNIIRKVILPMTETLSDVDARVVAGSRRAGATGDLLGRYRDSSRLVDLGDPEFYAEEDLAAYALATLQLADDEGREDEEGKEKPNPYADARVAFPVAARIAELSAGNFLVAGLTARARGMTDDTPRSPEQISFSPRISDVIDDYLELIPEVADIEARDLLTALAFAESPGLPSSLWRKAIQALGYGNVTEVQLARFTQTRAASFLIESSEQDGRGTVFRLFHQAVNDALLNADESGAARQAEEEALTRAFLSIGLDGGWGRAPTYLLRSLAAHAARAGLVDDLLADDAYLLHADLRRVMSAAERASSLARRDRARMLGLTPQAASAAPADRAAMFSVTEALDGLDTAYLTDRWHSPYRAHWAATDSRNAAIFLEDHQAGIMEICAITINGQTLLATACVDGTARLWNPVTGAQTHVLGQPDPVRMRGIWKFRNICAIAVNDRPLLAAIGDGGAVRLWDPVDGTQTHVFGDPRVAFNSFCAITVGDRPLLAIAGEDRTVRFCDPTDGAQIRVLKHLPGVVSLFCAITVNGKPLLATVSRHAAKVQLWGPADGKLVRILENPNPSVVDAIAGMCAITIDDRTLLATIGIDGTVRLWDPETGGQVRVMEGHQNGIKAICAVTIGGRPLLAILGTDGTVRFRDPATGAEVRVLEGHQGRLREICAVTVNGTTLLAAVGLDETAWLWDPADDGPQNRVIEGRQSGVIAICTVTVNGQPLLATASGDRYGIYGDEAVRLLDPADGTQIRVLAGDRSSRDVASKGHHDKVNAICAVTVKGRPLLATASEDWSIRLWNPATGQCERMLEGDFAGIRAICAITIDGRPLLATSSRDKLMRLWDPETGKTLRTRQGTATEICAITVNGRSLLATTSGDQMIRLWDPMSGTQPHSLECDRSWVSAFCAVTVRDRSLLAIAYGDGTVRLWDPADNTQIRALERHQSTVNAMCTVTVQGRVLLATASKDRTVRLWNPATCRCVLTVPVHHSPSAMEPMVNSLAIGLTAGMLVIKFDYFRDRARPGDHWRHQPP